jgi:ribosomal protein L37AE/L43A
MFRRRKEHRLLEQAINAELRRGLLAVEQIREQFDSFAKSKVAELERFFGHPPRCSSCGARMVVRLAKRKSHLGTKFWGCTNYPSCRNTVSIDAFGREALIGSKVRHPR